MLWLDRAFIYQTSKFSIGFSGTLQKLILIQIIYPSYLRV